MPEDESKGDDVKGASDNDDNASAYSVKGQKKIPYPKRVFLIFCTEACERYSYYGMRSVLSLYLLHHFEYFMEKDEAEDVATEVYHAFVFLAYASALLGAFLADSFFGKFKTIFYFCLLYVAGQVILALSALPKAVVGMCWTVPVQMALTFPALVMIAVGTGGIKPSVVSFGAEQFTLPEQEKEMSTFFMVFYFSINTGALLSTAFTPLLRNSSCFGEDQCFFLAFLIPAILMVLATIIFVLGYYSYKIIIPERNIVKDFVQAVCTGIRGKCKSTEKRDHWMDYAIDDWGEEFVTEVKAVLSVCVLFTTYPFFWALFDQQGSRWTFQATKMNGHVGGGEILPDQMQAMNSGLVLIFIPLFDRVIYPLLHKCHLLTKPLQKVVTGGILCGVSFIVSGIVQMQVEAKEGEVSILWQIPQYMIVTAGEVLFSITGLEFAFTQAPATMKSVVQALNLSTIAIGNVLSLTVIALSSELFESTATEMFIFAGLMFLSMFILMILARRYKYVRFDDKNKGATD